MEDVRDDAKASGEKKEWKQTDLMHSQFYYRKVYDMNPIVPQIRKCCPASFLIKKD